MLENILPYERKLFFLINGSHSDFIDSFMWLYSGYWIWILPILFLIAALVYKKKKEEWIPAIATILILFFVCNVFSGLICKPLFTRFRPTHHPDFMEQVRTLYEYRGRLYGFISGHSTSSFGFVTLTALMFRNRNYTFMITIWGLLMVYSRVYLGVHFISDIVAGTLSGIIIGLIVFHFYKKYITNHSKEKYKPVYSTKRTNIITVVIGGYILLFALLSGPLVSLFY